MYTSDTSGAVGVMDVGTLTFTRGQLAGQSFETEYIVCTNPVCSCDQVTLYFPVESRRVKATVAVSLHVNRGTIGGRDNLKACRRALELAEAVEVEMGEEQWTALRRSFLTFKQRRTEEADLSQLEVTFPREVLEEGRTASYGELFPYARPMEILVEGVPWIVEDQYCVQRSCSCEDTYLRFIEIVPEATEAQAQPLCLPLPGAGDRSVRYEYKRGKIGEYIGADAPAPSADHLVALLKDAEPDLDGKLAKRHALLRGLYRKALDTQQVSAPRPRGPGRNEPCPCGSGKKYKRCCGAG